MLRSRWWPVSKGSLRLLLQSRTLFDCQRNNPGGTGYLGCGTRNELVDIRDEGVASRESVSKRSGSGGVETVNELSSALSPSREPVLGCGVCEASPLDCWHGVGWWRTTVAVLSSSASNWGLFVPPLSSRTMPSMDNRTLLSERGCGDWQSVRSRKS